MSLSPLELKTLKVKRVLASLLSSRLTGQWFFCDSVQSSYTEFSSSYLPCDSKGFERWK